MIGYGPNEGDGEERERLWNYYDRIMDRVGNGYILCVLRDLNGWNRNMVRASITSAFGVLGRNDEKDC